MPHSPFVRWQRSMSAVFHVGYVINPLASRVMMELKAAQEIAALTGLCSMI